MNRFGALLCLFVGPACSARITDTFDLPLADMEAGFVALGREADGGAERVSEVFGVSSGALSFGALPNLQLSGADQTALLVVLDIEDVERAAPGFYPDQIKNLRAVVMAPPGTDKSVFSMEEQTLRIGLPAGTEVFAIDYRNSGALVPFEGDRRILFSSLSLIVPIDPERCRIPDLPPLAAFTEKVLNPPPYAPRDMPAGYINFDQLKAVDRDTVLARTSYSVRMLKRGQSTTSTVGVIYPKDLDAADKEMKFFNIDIDRTPRADGTYRVLVGGAEHLDPNAPFASGFVYELSVTSEGIVGSKLVDKFADAILGVAIDPQGKALLVGQLGNFYVLERDNTWTRELPVITSQNYAPNAFLATGDTTHPWAIGSTGVIYLFDDRSLTWEIFDIPLTFFSDVLGVPGVKSIDVDALASARAEDGRLELWASGSAGALLRKVGDEPWRIIDLVKPPRFKPCASGGDYPRMYFGGHLDALAVDGEHLFVTVRGCTALLEVRRRDQCVAMLEEADMPIGLLFNRDIQAMELIDGVIMAGGEQGALLQSGR